MLTESDMCTVSFKWLLFSSDTFYKFNYCHQEVTIKHLAKWCQGNSSYPMLRKVEAPLHQINVHALMRACVKVCLHGAAQMPGCAQAVSAQFLPMPSHGWPNTGTHKYSDRQAHTHSKHIRIKWMPLARLLLSLLCPLIPLHSLLSDLSFFFFWKIMRTSVQIHLKSLTSMSRLWEDMYCRWLI